MAKFALSAFADEAGVSIDEQIQALLRCGIDYIELRSVNGQNSLDLSDTELISIKAKLDEHGIKVSSLGSPIGKYPIDAPFDEHLSKFRRAIDVCKILQCERMRVFSFFVDPLHIADYRCEVLRRMKTLVKIASENGIQLCHENESKIYGCMPSEVSDLLSEVEGLYGVFDPANYRMNGADCIDGIYATMKRLGYIHIKDAIFSEQTIVPAGEGEGQIAEVLDCVNSATDEVVFLTIEPHLRLFDAYASIDEHELKGKYQFKTSSESFDFATNALKKLLIENNYSLNGENLWIK